MRVVPGWRRVRRQLCPKCQRKKRPSPPTPRDEAREDHISDIGVRPHRRHRNPGRLSEALNISSRKQWCRRVLTHDPALRIPAVEDTRATSRPVRGGPGSRRTATGAGGPLSRPVGSRAPRGLRSLTEAPSGLLPFWCPLVGLKSGREKTKTGREKESGSQLDQGPGLVYFSGHVEGETRRRAPNGGRPPGAATGPAMGNHREGQTRTAGNRREGQTRIDRETGRGRSAGSHRETGGGRWVIRPERGSFGIVERAGDHADRKVCTSLETGRALRKRRGLLGDKEGRSSDRSGLRGRTRRRLRPTAHPIGVGSPAQRRTD